MCLLTQLGQEIKRVERNNMRSAKAGGAEGGERGMSRESGGGPGGPGPSQFSEQQKEMCFQQTHNQGLCQLFLTVSWDLCATPGGVLVSL